MRALILSLLLFSCSASPVPAAGLLWVGAHPDDESYAAPLMHDLCVTQKKPCHMLVLTKGERGKCVIESCPPDLATFRAAELTSSAKYFGAGVTQLDLGDGAAGTPIGVISNWIVRAEGELQSKVIQVLDQAKPEVVLIFDPRHGSTCHPDHRAAGYLVLQVLRGRSEKAVLIENQSTYGSADGVPWVGFRPIVSADTAVQKYQAGESWQALSATLANYRSQFDTWLVDAARLAPTENRIVATLKATDLIEDDPRYANLCQ